MTHRDEKSIQTASGDTRLARLQSDPVEIHVSMYTNYIPRVPTFQTGDRGLVENRRDIVTAPARVIWRLLGNVVDPGTSPCQDLPDRAIVIPSAYKLYIGGRMPLVFWLNGQLGNLLTFCKLDSSLKFARLGWADVHVSVYHCTFDLQELASGPIVFETNNGDSQTAGVIGGTQIWVSGERLVPNHFALHERVPTLRAGITPYAQGQANIDEEGVEWAMKTPRRHRRIDHVVEYLDNHPKARPQLGAPDSTE